MKKKKQWIAILIIACLLSGMLGNHYISEHKHSEDSGTDYQQEKSSSQMLTRYQWMKMLGEYFGFTEPNGTQALWEDVPKDNSYYKYIQSASEWEILKVDGKFYGNKAVTGEFMAQTMIQSIGEDLFDLYIEKHNNNLNYTSLYLLEEKGFIQERELKRKIKKQRAEKFFKDVTAFYDMELHGIDSQKIVYKKDVKRIPLNSVMQMDDSIENIKVRKKYARKLKKGTPVVVDTKFGMLAKEVVRAKKNGEITLKDTALDNVLESLQASQSTTIGFEDFVQAYGTKKMRTNYKQYKEMSMAENNYQALNLARIKNSVNTSQGDTLSREGFTVNFSVTSKGEDGEKETSCTIIDNKSKMGFEYTEGQGFKVLSNGDMPWDISAEENTPSSSNAPETTASSLEKGKEEKYKLKTEKSSSIMASVAINNISIYSYVDMGQDSLIKKIVPEKVDIRSTIASSIEFSADGSVNLGKTIASIPFPIGAGKAFGINLDLRLILDANGQVKLGIENTNTSGLVYEKGKGIRRIDPKVDKGVKDPEQDIVVQASMELEPKLEFQPNISVLGKNLVDLELDVGVYVQFSVTGRISEGVICDDRRFAAPTFSFGYMQGEGNLIIKAEQMLQKGKQMLQKVPNIGGVVKYVDDKIPDLKLSGEINILTDENAPFQLHGHYENGIRVEKCNYDDESTDAKKQEEHKKDQQKKIVSLKELKYSGQTRFIQKFNNICGGYESQLEMEYYPYISQEEFSSKAEGDEFQIQGKTYRIGKSYETFIPGKGGSNKDPVTGKRYSDVYNPHGCSEIYGEDGTKYYIQDALNPQITRRGAIDSRGFDYGGDSYIDCYDYMFCDVNGQILKEKVEIPAYVIYNATIKMNSGEGGEYTAMQFYLLHYLNALVLNDDGLKDQKPYNVSVQFDNSGWITQIQMIDTILSDA